ncbi:MAG TPA: universal stress protein [Candidatus Dormibacteraeota bacterium]
MQNHEWRFNRIVVGLDGSPGSAHAVQWAIALAKRTGAEIIATHVLQPVTTEYSGMFGFIAPVSLDTWVAEIRQQFEEEWCLPLYRADVPFRKRFETGSAGQRLIEVSEREVAGLIVTGTRGLGPVREAFLGSVSHYLIQHARVPVVVVPPDRTVPVREAAAVVGARPIPMSGVPS